MFREFVRRLPDVPRLASMTEFGRTPYLTASEFESMGYAMIIWPVSSLRAANKAQDDLYRTIAHTGGTRDMLERMQTREELYKTIRYYDYEALDAGIVSTVLPHIGQPDRSAA